MNKLSKLLLECGVETGVVSSVGNNEVPVVGNIDGQESIECCSDEEMDKAINESKVYKLFESTVFPVNALLETDNGNKKGALENLKNYLIELWKKITGFVMHLVKRVRSFMMEKLGMYEKILKANNIDEGLAKISDNIIKGKVYYTDGEFKKYLNKSTIDVVYDSMMKKSGLNNITVEIQKGIFTDRITAKAPMLYNTGKQDVEKAFIEIFNGGIDKSDDINRENVIAVFRGDALESPKIKDLNFSSSYIKDLINGIKNISAKDEKELLKEVKKSSGDIAKIKDKIMSDNSFDTMTIRSISEGHASAIKLCTLLYQVRMDVVRETAFLAYKVGNAAIKAVA